jgi:hypothetical protein
MSSVKPQVDLPPYKVVWPEDFKPYLRNQRVTFVKTAFWLSIDFDRMRYFDKWQPYYSSIIGPKATQHAVRDN